MNYRHALIVLAAAVGLAACTSYPSSYRDRSVYSDGSYYSRAGDGYGDYYYAPQPNYNDYPGYYGPSYFSYSYGNCWQFGGCSPWGFSGYWGPYSHSGLSIFYRQGGWAGRYGSYWGPYSNRGHRIPRQSGPAPRPRMNPDNDRREFRQPPPEMRRPGTDNRNFQPRRERSPDRSVPTAGSQPGNGIFRGHQPAPTAFAAGNDRTRMGEHRNVRIDRAGTEAMQRSRFESRPPVPAPSRPVAMLERTADPSVSAAAPRASRQAQTRLPEKGVNAVQDQ